EALGALRHFEFHVIAVMEALEAIAFDRGEVDEYILAPLLRNEAEALCLVEPLHGATIHLLLLHCWGSPRAPVLRRPTRRPAFRSIDGVRMRGARPTKKAACFGAGGLTFCSVLPPASESGLRMRPLPRRFHEKIAPAEAGPAGAVLQSVFASSWKSSTTS